MIDPRDFILVGSQAEIHAAEIAGGIDIDPLSHVAVLEHGAVAEDMVPLGRVVGRDFAVAVAGLVTEMSSNDRAAGSPSMEALRMASRPLSGSITRPPAMTMSLSSTVVVDNSKANIVAVPRNPVRNIHMLLRILKSSRRAQVARYSHIWDES
ncbi:D-glutamate deacylase [Stappia aggregata IAM 12614]|uniref:D-glutamate deacylase n=1 Tax=Roseibium aggregatum (strain ATCC 25650 / DSM 13394 / JCM 20685 / NBRC 16684 / NCIMB 2208 / IAM 12614 / B1) TaxID=384765 RepID=A0NUC3_ROSAI|nr:hypothetical protein [Roseibium aggregatum]EAV43525.1 D-glutamate deacylase [Stappia aggregata IAM 12614] [Roseibium aggregatum IAM 12614]